MKFEDVKEWIFCYGWAVLSIAVVAGAIYSGWFDGDVQTYPDGYQEDMQIIDVKDYAVEEWDFNVYSSYLNEPCFDHCMFEIENNDPDEAYDTCIDRCMSYEVSFYKDSYCNITCDDGASFRLNLGMPDGMAMPAQVFVIDNNDSLADCSAVCYGLFIGFGYR